MIERVIAKFQYTWSLMGASWHVLRQDKEMLLFPLLSGISCLAVMAVFAIPVFSGAGPSTPGPDAPPAEQVVFYGLMFLYYVANYFVITFFNTAIIACAIKRMGGGDPTFAEGIGEAMQRLPLILGWALVAATVGVLLRLIQGRSGRAGALIAGIAGVAWTLATFLVVPILVMENKGPLAALKESGRLLKSTWGEQLVGNFSFGAVFFVINLPALAALLGGIALAVSGSGPLGYSLIALAVVYLLIAGLVQAALQCIFQAAVYLYATGKINSAGAGGRGFPVTLIRNAVGNA